jgi:hypothetical protein
MIRKLRIHHLKAQVGLRQLVCETLAKEFEARSLTVEQRTALAHRWDDAMKESHELRLMVERQAAFLG